MKWRKLGKIFDPVEHHLINNCFEFAQSPQTLVFDDFVRIYFSTREKDSAGKYLSHIAFVDMDKQFSKVLRVSENTVIELGDLGTFDEHGIFPMNVLRRGNEVLAYTSGWNRKVSVSVDASIGLAISKDQGLTFKKVGSGPVLTSSLFEPFLVGDGFVKIVDDHYHMWYVFGCNWRNDPETGIPERTYKIGHATSKDGVEWIKEGRPLITDKLNTDENQALPTVIEYDGCFHMYFCYRQAFGFRTKRANSYRLGYAYSQDLVNWTRDDSIAGIDVSESGWDSEMMCYPHILQCDKQIYLLYNGNEFGRTGFGIAILESI